MMITTKEAVTVLSEHLRNDKDLAFSWHCNIAMAFYDSIHPNDLAHKDAHEVSNEAASRFMMSAFKVHTSNSMLTDRPICDLIDARKEVEG